MAIVGSSVVVGKLIVATVPVMLVAALRLGLASTVLVPLVLAREGGLPAVERRDVIVLVLQAFMGMFVFNALLLSGLRFTTAAEGGIVTATTPAVAAILSVVFLGERVDMRGALGIALAVAGILAVNALSSAPMGARGPAPLVGNVLVFGAVVGEASYIVCGKIASRRVPPLIVATALSGLGFLMFLPFALWQSARFDFALLGTREWLAIVYYAVAGTVIAAVLWSRGLIHVPASTAGAFSGVLPISAVALSYVVLGERFAWSHVLGAACVIAGILLLARPR